jgi:hypothetical protein
LTTAACGGLRPAPDCRPRRALLHLSYSSALSYSDSAFVTHAPFRTLPEGLPSRWVGSSGRSYKETTRFRPYRSCGSGIAEDVGSRRCRHGSSRGPEVGRTLQHAPNIDKPRLRGVTLPQAHPKSGSVGQGGRSRTERGGCGRSMRRRDQGGAEGAIEDGAKCLIAAA